MREKIFTENEASVEIGLGRHEFLLINFQFTKYLFGCTNSEMFLIDTLHAQIEICRTHPP